MNRPLFYSWLFFWFCVTLGGSFISLLAFLILTFDGWCHVLICQCNFLFPLEDLQGWILVYEDKSWLRTVFFVFLKNSVTSIIYWCVTCKATCGAYTHQNCDRHGRVCILLSFKQESVYFAEFQAQVSHMSEYFEETLNCAAVLSTEHIERNWF